MGANTDGDFGVAGGDRYRRRRAGALAGVLGAVGVLAWACVFTGEDEPVRGADAAESASPPPAPTAMPTVTVTRTTAPGADVEDGGPCHRTNLVIDMTTARKVYPAAGRPEFRITVVNTGRGVCGFDPDVLDVRITSGRDRIWSSARCRRGGTPGQRLRRGIPYVETVTWNRRRGCGGGVPARPGTYVAALKGGEAKKQVFHLR